MAQLKKYKSHEDLYVRERRKDRIYRKLTRLDYTKQTSSVRKDPTTGYFEIRSRSETDISLMKQKGARAPPAAIAPPAARAPPATTKRQAPPAARGHRNEYQVKEIPRKEDQEAEVRPLKQENEV